MKVVILCGGKGTRLREETEFRPKPMIAIGDYPILWHIMKYYSCFGHTDFILCLGYKGEIIKEYFRNYLWNTCDVTFSLSSNTSPIFHTHHEENWTVTLANTGLESLTGYRIKKIQPYINSNETFLLTYGDGVSNIDINSSIESHYKAKKHLTISAVHPAGRFGSLGIDRFGQIQSFKEKPQFETAYVNGGYMVCDYHIFDYIDDDPLVAFENEPMTRLVNAGQINSYCHEGWWQPMDTYKEAQYLNQLWEQKKAPWKIW